MAAGLVCNVVYLAQQPPPVPVLLDGMAVPRPLPTRYSLAQKLARHRHGAYRWRRPAYHPNQVRAWAVDSHLEDELRESLVVMGPSSISQTQHRLSRAITAPPASLQSSSEGDDHDQDEDRKEDSKTPQSNFSFKDLVPRCTEDVVTVFPVRPPISGGKDRKFPGRLFSKPTLTEDQTDQLGYFQHAKPTVTPRPHSWFPSRKSRNNHPINLSLCVTHRSHHYDPPVFNQGGVQAHQDIVLRPRIFTVRSSRKAADSRAKTCPLVGSKSSDPNGDKGFTKLPLTKRSRSSDTNDDIAAVVVHGHRKLLHTKLDIGLEQTALAGGSGRQAAVGGDGSTRSQLAKAEAQTHKVGTVETDESDTNGIAGNIHAPLNSPTDQKDPSFPELS